MYRLEHSGLGRYFQAVVTGDQVSKSKPDPEIYRAACQRLDVSPAKAVAVEDSPNGIRSALSAGMSAVMIPDLIPSSPELDCKRKNSRRLVRVKWLCQTIRV